MEIVAGDISKQQAKGDTMFDFKSHYALIKSVMQDKAKEEHKPSLANKASMQAYAKAVGATGRASFGLPQIEAIDYV